MQPCQILRASVIAAFAVSLIAGATACQGSVKVKASTQESRDEEPVEATSPSAAQPTTEAPAPVAAQTPRTDACPLSCFESRGSQRATMTEEEHTQLRGALEPVLSRMRACTSEGEWRRYGSPVINLRIAPDGTLAELGVDPHHRSDSDCFDQVGRGANASLALPGRKVVRCSERCVRETPQRRRRRR